MKQNICPNCTGRLEPSPNRRKLICPYCGSEFASDIDIDEAFKNGDLINKDWFICDWKYDELMSKPASNTAVTAFVKYLNEYGSSDKLEEFIRTYLMDGDDISAPGIREEKMSGIKARVSSFLEADEHIVLYNDDALFIHGKTGLVITDKRALFVGKKKVTDVPYSKVPYLFFGYSFGLPEIRLGERYDNNISPMGSNYELVGAVAALICFFSFEKDPGRPKIRLITAWT